MLVLVPLFFNLGIFFNVTIKVLSFLCWFWEFFENSCSCEHLYVRLLNLTDIRF